MMRAAWLTQDNNLAEAAVLLKPLVHRFPSAAVERFRIDLALNDREQAATRRTRSVRSNAARCENARVSRIMNTNRG